MLHAGGDSYPDQSQPLDGRGARVACGVVPWEGIGVAQELKDAGCVASATGPVQ